MPTKIGFIFDGYAPERKKDDKGEELHKGESHLKSIATDIDEDQYPRLPPNGGGKHYGFLTLNTSGVCWNDVDVCPQLTQVYVKWPDEVGDGFKLTPYYIQCEGKKLLSLDSKKQFFGQHKIKYSLRCNEKEMTNYLSQCESITLKIVREGSILGPAEAKINLTPGVRKEFEQEIWKNYANMYSNSGVKVGWLYGDMWITWAEH